MSKIDRDKTGRMLPDGKHIIDTLVGANAAGLTPPAFIAAAKRAGIKRWAARGRRGAVSHFWDTDAVEVMIAERFSKSLTPVVAEDEIVELPYDRVK